MKECFAFMTDIYETCVKARHDFLDSGSVDVAYGVVCIELFFLELYESFIFEQRDGDFVGL